MTITAEVTIEDGQLGRVNLASSTPENASPESVEALFAEAKARVLAAIRAVPER